MHIFKHFKRKINNDSTKKCPCEVRMLYGIQLPDAKEQNANLKKTVEGWKNKKKGELISIKEFEKVLKKQKKE